VNRYPRELSGERRQRLAIARALAVELRLIDCDEQTSAPDALVQVKIINLVRELQDELGARTWLSHSTSASSSTNGGRSHRRGRAGGAIAAKD